MGEARGIVSQEEMLVYGGANAVLLDDTNNTTDSSTGFASGSSNYNWSISWNITGFTGVSWHVSDDWNSITDNLQSLYASGGDSAVKSFLEADENVGIAIGLSGRIQITGTFVMSDCVTYERA